MQKTDIASCYKEMFDVGAEADDADGGDAGVDQDEEAVNVAVVGKLRTLLRGGFGSQGRGPSL